MTEHDACENAFRNGWNSCIKHLLTKTFIDPCSLCKFANSQYGELPCADCETKDENGDFTVPSKFTLNEKIDLHNFHSI